MTTAQKFTIFYENMKIKSVWLATRYFAEEAIVKFYGSRINGKQTIRITFADMSQWEGEENLAK